MGSGASGWLVSCLAVFAFAGVNLTRIESRPLRRGMGEYMFFLDLEGSMADPAVSGAVQGLRSHAELVRVLGSFATVRVDILRSVAYRYTPRTWQPLYPQDHWGPCRSETTRGTDLKPDGSSSRWSGGRVLVLNATYEPINVCTVRRATVLLLKDKAEMVEVGTQDLHWATGSLPRPVVIRLVTYVRIPRDTHKRKITRRAVFARDGWMCQYCGARTSLTVDHVIPRSKGGGSGWDNIVASCAPCNRRKADRLPHQINMHPRTKPHTPGAHIFIQLASPTIPATWRQYLPRAA